MIRESGSSTRKLHLESTCDVRPQDEDSRFLKIAVRRCVRNAAGQPAPRNQFERFVSDRLKGSPSPDQSGRLTSGVSQLADELWHGIRMRLPLNPITGSSST